jgi:hypothetical protein
VDVATEPLLVVVVVLFFAGRVARKIMMATAIRITAPPDNIHGKGLPLRFCTGGVI